MTVRRTLIAAVTLAAAIQAGPSWACFVHVLGNDGLSVYHPGTLSVASAVRRASADGYLEPLPSDRDERFARLIRVRVLATRHISSLWNEGAVRASDPPLYVLLTQSGTWMRLGGKGEGPAFHTDSPPSEAAVVLIPDVAYEELLRGNVSSDDLERQGIVRVWSDEPDRMREIWLRSLEAFEEAAPSSL